MRINETIRLLRKHSGKSQQVFATELGISLRAFQKYEQEQLPEPRALVRLIAMALDQRAETIRIELAKALLEQLAVPGWTVRLKLVKRDGNEN